MTDMQQPAGEDRDAALAAHKAWLADCIDVLRQFTRCPLSYEHRVATPDDPRRLRYDCADDQCTYSGCVTYGQCNRPQHDAARLVEAYDLAMASANGGPT